MLTPKRDGSDGNLFSDESHRHSDEPAGVRSKKQLSRILRQEREHRKISLQEVGRLTRIPLNYLQLLEGEGDERLVPDPMYLISPLRDYAAFLNLDLGTALTEFIAEVEELASAEEKASSSVRPTHLLDFFPQLRSWISPRTLILLLPLGILAVIGYSNELTQGPRPEDDKVALLPSPSAPPAPPQAEPAPLVSSPTPSASPPEVDQPEPSSPPPAMSPPITAALQAQPSEAAAPRVEPPVGHSLPQPQKSPGSAPHRLRVRAKAKTWLHVTIDDQPMKRVFLQPGQLVQWSAKRGFTLSVGNARAVKLTLDGQELPPLGKAGQVVFSLGLPSHRGSQDRQVREAEHSQATKPRSPRH